MTDKDKLCREIAERHGLNTQQFPHLIDVIVIAMLEAYDKGHDAGAREQREKDAHQCESYLPQSHKWTEDMQYASEMLAAAIRAGRE